MADGESNSQIGADILTKFNFYAVGLTFGVLALSIQTASFDTYLPARIAELAGWLALLVSGTIGLWRLEWMPTLYKLTGLRVETEQHVHEFQKATQQGVKVVHVTSERKDKPIEELIMQAQGDLGKIKARLGDLERRSLLKYRIQRWTFVVGVLCLIVARGWTPLLDILRDL